MAKQCTGGALPTQLVRKPGASVLVPCIHQPASDGSSLGAVKALTRTRLNRSWARLAAEASASVHLSRQTAAVTWPACSVGQLGWQ